MFPRRQRLLHNRAVRFGGGTNDHRIHVRFTKQCGCASISGHALRLGQRLCLIYVQVRDRDQPRSHDAHCMSRVDPGNMPRPDDAVPFITFMESLTVDGLDLTRDRDTGRDVEL